MLSSSTAVLVPVPASKHIQTEALIATSDLVLLAASRNFPAQSFEQLRRHVRVTVLSSAVLLVTVTAKTAAGARWGADAVALSYEALVRRPGAPGGQVRAALLDSASPATRTSVSAWVAETAWFGALVGLVFGVIAALALIAVPKRRRLI